MDLLFDIPSVKLAVDCLRSTTGNSARLLVSNKGDAVSLYTADGSIDIHPMLVNFKSTEFDRIAIDISLADLGAVLKTSARSSVISLNYEIGEKFIAYKIHASATDPPHLLGIIKGKTFDELAEEQLTQSKGISEILRINSSDFTRVVSVLGSIKGETVVKVYDSMVEFSCDGGEINYTYSLSSMTFDADGKLTAALPGWKRFDVVINNKMFKSLGKLSSGTVTISFLDDRRLIFGFSIDSNTALSVSIEAATA